MFDLDKIILLNERVYSAEELGTNSDKIEQVVISERLTYKKVFEYYTQLAIKKNVFGAPTYIIDDQIYWGQDRLDFVERHLLSLN